MGSNALTQTGLIVLCLVLSAAFSACETAVTTLGRTRTTRMLEAGDWTSRAIRLWAERPREVLITILICNNIVNISASAIATTLAQSLLSEFAATIPWLDPVGVAVFVMTLLLLTFGEITPKTVARDRAESLSPVLMSVVRPFYTLVYPITRFFVLLTDTIGGESDENSVKEEDIEHLVRLAKQDGNLDSERERLLRSVFAFTETQAREVMVPRTDIDFIPCDIALDVLLTRIVNGAHSRMPVYEGNTDNIVGLCYARDLLQFVNARDKAANFDLRRYLRPAKFVPETKPISQLLGEMQQQRIHMSIIVDEFGGVSGLVTLEDIIEQFFGDIQDEFDREEEWMQVLPTGGWRVDARLNFDEFLELIKYEDPSEFEAEDFDTLGGYIAMKTGMIDARGHAFEDLGHRFTVVDATARRIKWVRVEPIQPPAADARLGNSGEFRGLLTQE